MDNIGNNAIFFNSIILIIFLPLLGFIVNGIFGKKINNEKIIGLIGTSTVSISFLTSLYLFIYTNLYHIPSTVVNLYRWLNIGDFQINISYQIDNLSLIFMMIITGVGALIHIYSISYMHTDRSFYRFFAYLNLFIFMMLNLVASSNLLLTFFGWEGVGLSSYLLIGFWYDREFKGYNIKLTKDAANKAFIVNRIGDFGFLIAAFLIFTVFKTFEYSNIAQQAIDNKLLYQNSTNALLISMFMFLACTGKSAQLPLSVWLPDAMAGPTPVSALIHAATMVTAGIFLVARNSVLFAMSDVTMGLVTIIGILTALYGAFSAITQTDIKKVLAYSTVSQLGFMFAALGMGAYSAAVFHVVTHAFFKGLLFLAAGSIIHSMHDEQDILKMGNLKKYMPITFITFLIGTLAISGIPLFSGFFSKDEILWNVYSNGNLLYWLFLLLASLTTALYMFRLLYLVFFGKEKFNNAEVHPHESPRLMTVPLLILAVLSAIGGFIGIPYSLGFWFSKHPNLFDGSLFSIFSPAREILKLGTHQSIEPMEYILMTITLILIIGSIIIARKFYLKREYSISDKLANSAIYKLSLNKFYLDNIYHTIIVNPLIWVSDKVLKNIIDNGAIDGFIHTISQKTIDLGSSIKKLQTGKIQDYLYSLTFGVILILVIVIIAFI
ncbi:MAG: NADH-quinone oxidoreductase subunit L [bacterium]